MITWNKETNHQEEVRRMIEKGYNNKMKPIEMLHFFILEELIPTLDPTKQLLIEKIMQLRNCECDMLGAYERGVNDMTDEVQSMAEYIKERLTK
jgi:hypothetical protein